MLYLDLFLQGLVQGVIYALIAVGLTLVCMMFFVANCSDDDSVLRPEPETETWEWKSLYPFPPGNDLHGICGDDEGGLFVVGEVGTVIHFDGADRSVGSIGDEISLFDICASSSSNAYAHPNWSIDLYHYDFDSLWNYRCCNRAHYNGV